MFGHVPIPTKLGQIMPTSAVKFILPLVHRMWSTKTISASPSICTTKVLHIYVSCLLLVHNSIVLINQQQLPKTELPKPMCLRIGASKKSHPPPLAPVPWKAAIHLHIHACYHNDIIVLCLQPSHTCYSLTHPLLATTLTWWDLHVHIFYFVRPVFFPDSGSIHVGLPGDCKVLAFITAQWTSVWSLSQPQMWCY